MTSLKQFEFFLLRWMPDVVTGEFTNVGVVLFDDAGRAHVRFTTDWRRAKCLDASLDTNLFEALEAELRQRLSDDADRKIFMQKVTDWASNSLQMTAATAVLGESVEAELAKLAGMYLEPVRRAGKREVSGRAAIYNQMRTTFSEHGVWDLMWKRVAMSKYTHKGDPLKIDCGYRPNGVVRLFQAVSLTPEVDAAKVLAFSYPQVREGIARVESAKTELTAIVEDELDRDDEQIAFAIDTMQRSEIIVAPTSELAAIAERARRELRV